MRNLFAAILLIVLATGCGRSGDTFAEVGNGGHGVVIDGKVFLVDLVEEGIASTARLSDPEPPRPENFAGHLRYGALVNDPTKKLFPYEAVGRKLNALYADHPVLAMTLLEVIRMYSWNIIDRDLSPLPLRGNVVSFKEGSVVLAALRRGRSIYLNLKVFERMDEVNRAATIFHEALYALIKPVRIEKGLSVQLTQNVARVREITGYLFAHDRFSRRVEARRLADILGDDEFPNGDGVRSATVASHLGTYWLRGQRERSIIFNPKLTLIGGPHHNPFRLELDSWRNPLYEHEAIEREGRVLELKGKAQITFEISSGEKAFGLRLTFAEYQEGEELKTYVRFEESKVPIVASVSTHPMFRPRDDGAVRRRGDPNSEESGTDWLARMSWIALMRTDPKLYFPPESEQGKSPHHQAAVKLAQETKATLKADWLNTFRFGDDD